MENIIYSIVAAVIGLGVLIVFHEFGHFLFAKMFGVGVLTFSVGFGPKLLVKKKGETEYALSAFPLGGYVKMVGEDPDEEVQQADVEKSFAHKGLLQRMAIVAAGPGFNLLLAVFLLMIVFVFYGVPVLSTQVGGVESGSPADRAGRRGFAAQSGGTDSDCADGGSAGAGGVRKFSRVCGDFEHKPRGPEPFADPCS